MTDQMDKLTNLQRWKRWRQYSIEPKDGSMEVFATAIDLLGEYADMLKAVKVQL